MWPGASKVESIETESSNSTERTKSEATLQEPPELCVVVEDQSLDGLDFDTNAIMIETAQGLTKKLDQLQESKDQLVEEKDQLVEELNHQRAARRNEQQERVEDGKKMAELYSLLGGQGELQSGIDGLTRQILCRLPDLNEFLALKTYLEERFHTVDVTKIYEKLQKMTLKIISLEKEKELAQSQCQSTSDSLLAAVTEERDELQNKLSEMSIRQEEFERNRDWQDIQNIKRICKKLGRHENDPRPMSEFLETRIAQINDDRIELNRMKQHTEEFCGRQFRSANEMKRCLDKRQQEFLDLTCPILPVEDEVPSRELSQSQKFRRNLSPSDELFEIRRITENFLSERCRIDRMIFNRETPFYRQFESKLKTLNLTEDWASQLIKELKSERDDLLNVLTDYKGGVNLNSQFKTPQEIAEKLNDMKTNAIAQCFDVFDEAFDEKTDEDATEFLFLLISEYYEFTIQRKRKLFEDLRNDYCAPHIKMSFLVGGLSRVIRDCYEPKDEQFLNERGDTFGELLEHMRNGGLLSEIVKECGVLSFLVVWSGNPRLELYPIGEEEWECRDKKFNPRKYEELFATAKRTEDHRVKQVVFPGLFEEGDEGKKMPSSAVCVLIKEE